jgi:hypothetical protein
MLVVKEMPCAFCAKCRAAYTSVSQLKCTRPGATRSKRCNGAITLALSGTDWEECPSCYATGRELGEECGHCGGTGWLFARKRRGSAELDLWAER